MDQQEFYLPDTDGSEIVVDREDASSAVEAFADSGAFITCDSGEGPIVVRVNGRSDRAEIKAVLEKAGIGDAGIRPIRDSVEKTYFGMPANGAHLRQGPIKTRIPLPDEEKHVSAV